MVWGLRLIAGSEGPSLISLAASHLLLTVSVFVAHVVGQFEKGAYCLDAEGRGISPPGGVITPSLTSTAIQSAFA